LPGNRDAGQVDPILILGLGNPLLGDEGIGVRVIEELHHYELPDGVAVVEGGTGGLSLMSLMEGRQKVIVVDAADMGRPPGSVVRFTPEEVRLKTGVGLLSLHQVGLGEALALADALGVSPNELVIIGVQPFSMGVGERLSPRVERVVEQCIAQVLEEV
jgi:hydrogenase maturation protease